MVNNGNGLYLLAYQQSGQSLRSENCRKELNFAIDEHIPVVAVHLAHTELTDGMRLTLSNRQAISKHDITAQAYQEKLQTRLANYLGGSM